MKVLCTCFEKAGDNLSCPVHGDPMSQLRRELKAQDSPNIHALKNAIQNLLLADENLLAATDRGALENAAEAWGQLATEQKRFIQACAGR